MSNMYPKELITKTRNYIGGQCRHGCKYCYVESLKKYPAMKKRYSGELRVIEGELKKNEGKGHTIFVCDCNDMFQELVIYWDIIEILEHLKDYPDNVYWFQTKNPHRMMAFIENMPSRRILCTTIETDIEELIKGVSQGAYITSVADRMCWFGNITGEKKVVTIEPIMQFTDDFAKKIIKIKPEIVTIGADSKNSGLTEPSKEEIKKLASELHNAGIKVFLKKNIRRLWPEAQEGWYATA